MFVIEVRVVRVYRQAFRALRDLLVFGAKEVWIR